MVRADYVCGEVGLPGPARPAAAVRALGLAGDGCTAALLVASRLSGRAGAAAAGAVVLLGLRPAGSHGCARGQRPGCGRRRAGFPSALRGSPPDEAVSAAPRVPGRGPDL